MPFSKRPSGCNLVVSFTIYQKTIDKCKEKPKRKWICFLIKNHLSVENMNLARALSTFTQRWVRVPIVKKRCIMGTMTNPFGVLLKFILRRICAKIFWNDPIWTDFIQILFFCFVVVWRNAMPQWAEEWILLPKFATDQCESSHTKVLYFV